MVSQKFNEQSSVNRVEEKQRQAKNSQVPSTPKIIVCPPVEDTSDQISIPRRTRIFRALHRRLGRHNDSDSINSSSSMDSVSCEAERSDRGSSGSASDSGSDASERRRRHSSTVSLRRVFQSLNLTIRSQSCSPTERRQPKKQAQPKRILRPPVTYTYVKGLSGLPTQRVPRNTAYCASSGLYR